MARTGINIRVTNTVLGAPPSVNSNSLLMVVGCTAVPGGSMPFVLETPYMLQSLEDLTALGVTLANNPDLYYQVSDYYSQAPGSILWIVGLGVGQNVGTLGFDLYVRQTVSRGFQYRPRNILISHEITVDGIEGLRDFQSAVNGLYTDGFCVAVIVGMDYFNGSVLTSASAYPDYSEDASPMVSLLGITNRLGHRACVGLVGGFMASLSVGTSIGDASLPPLSNTLYWLDGTSDSSDVTWINTACANVPTNTLNTLGDKQILFARTRPPRNGLWMNDGATADEPTNALSTLEAVRTIAAMTDDLRLFFTPYLNNKIPVNNEGDIRSDYKQVVLDDARSKIIQPYIDSGDISDARLSMKALNNDMIGTRTWEVTLEILPAPTLRWINGYVFYVSSLN